MQEELIHLVNTEQENYLVNSFVNILEKNVGTEYYSNLYLCFTSFESLINNNQKLRELIEKNNSHLDAYVEKTATAKNQLQKFKKSFNTACENLFDVNYQEDLHEKIEQLKQEANDAFELMLQTNEILHPVDELETEIKQLKNELKEYVADINFAYKSLRNLKQLKIFDPAVREQCFAEFANLVEDSQTANRMFKQLWDLAIVEAQGLNEIANFAKKIVIQNPTGVEEFDDKTLTKANSLIVKYDEVFSKISHITDEEIEF